MIQRQRHRRYTDAECYRDIPIEQQHLRAAACCRNSTELAEQAGNNRVAGAALFTVDFRLDIWPLRYQRGGVSFIVKRIFLHRVHNSPDIFQRHAGVQAVNHHQPAVFAAQFCYLVTDRRVYLNGSAIRGNFLAINVQINADTAFQILRDPINAVDQTLQVQRINAAVNGHPGQQAVFTALLYLVTGGIEVCVPVREGVRLACCTRLEGDCRMTLSGHAHSQICLSGVMDTAALRPRFCTYGAAVDIGTNGEMALTQKDVRMVQLAKSAISAGLRTLMHTVASPARMLRNWRCPAASAAIWTRQTPDESG